MVDARVSIPPPATIADVWKVLHGRLSSILGEGEGAFVGGAKFKLSSSRQEAPKTFECTVTKVVEANHKLTFSDGEITSNIEVKAEADRWITVTWTCSPRQDGWQHWRDVQFDGLLALRGNFRPFNNKHYDRITHPSVIEALPSLVCRCVQMIGPFCKDPIHNYFMGPTSQADMEFRKDGKGMKQIAARILGRDPDQAIAEAQAAAAAEKAEKAKAEAK